LVIWANDSLVSLVKKRNMNDSIVHTIKYSIPNLNNLKNTVFLFVSFSLISIPERQGLPRNEATAWHGSMLSMRHDLPMRNGVGSTDLFAFDFRLELIFLYFSPILWIEYYK